MIPRRPVLTLGLITGLTFALLAGNGVPFTASAADEGVENAPEAATNAAAEAAARPDQASRPARKFSGDRVHLGSNLRMQAYETASEAVAVFGSTEVAGTVQGNLATVFGSSTMTGSVGENMATVFGSSKMDGHVGGDMVTVFGNTEVNGTVEGNLVTVFGSIKLGSNAVVNDQCVAVFGPVERHPNFHGPAAPAGLLARLVRRGAAFRALRTGRAHPAQADRRQRPSAR
jgi:hypothetical protein